jgi:hypothetical protein
VPQQLFFQHSARLDEQATVNGEQVSILLGHSNIKVTQQHYNPWVRDRQLQLEADLQRAWNRDPIVLLNSKGPGAEIPELTLPN